MIDDDNQFVVEPTQLWLDKISSHGRSWYDYIWSKSCSKMQPAFNQFPQFYDICYPEEAEIPQKPMSRYRKLLSQSRRMKRLRYLMPKWFRTPQSKPLTKSNF